MQSAYVLIFVSAEAQTQPDYNVGRHFPNPKRRARWYDKNKVISHRTMAKISYHTFRQNSIVAYNEFPENEFEL